MSAKSPDTAGRERRRYPRAQIEGQVTLTLKSGTFHAKLRDISRAGVSFYLERSVPLMTLLELSLDLPGAAGPVIARGAVVRCERIGPSVEHWEIAVFLHETTEANARAIDAFVAARSSTKTVHTAASAGE
ncbi:MAG: PilZ domain-containing protein [Planctomycetes bacterium]|nr:PilZ domain-containing protein [Planctomycetota bacterium]